MFFVFLCGKWLIDGSHRIFATRDHKGHKEKRACYAYDLPQKNTENTKKEGGEDLKKELTEGNEENEEVQPRINASGREFQAKPENKETTSRRLVGTVASWKLALRSLCSFVASGSLVQEFLWLTSIAANRRG